MNTVIRAGTHVVKTGWVIPLIFKQMPGTTFIMNGGNALADGSHAAICLPDQTQAFMSVPVQIWNCSQNAVATYTWSPSYIWTGRLDIWSVDTAGADIEQVIVAASLTPFAALPTSGTIHGNNYWKNGGAWNLISNTGRHVTSAVYIAGFRAATTISHGSGTVTVPSMTAWLGAMSF